ncbi:MAG TPA: SDR family NAD(P)-dependent oxidoreductase [Gemmataceae bacterium]|nr:SDR family NAD(P)-dependent oxidoreductase [Gemmataceae bacterium]
MRNLDAKRVLITGGARGLGRALATAFANAGANVIISDLDAAAADVVAASLKRAASFRLDVTDPADVANVRARILAAGPIDVLVNNAGVVFGGPFTAVSAERQQQTIAVNLNGVVGMTHAFLPDLLNRPEAHLINIASASAFIPLPNAAVYAATKWAVLGFTEALREELRLLGHRHIGVTAVCPSYVDTGLFAGARPPRFTRWLTAEEVAAATVRAVQRRQELVLLPRRIRLLLGLGNLLPRPLRRRLISWTGVSTSMAAWRGRM